MPIRRLAAVRVAIAGGHGQIALRLGKLLSQRGDEAVALIRNPDQADEVRHAGAEPVVVDLEHASEEEVAQAIAGSDAVVFAAGAGPGSGPQRKETMDYGGAVKLIAAAKRAGVGRYLIVSWPLCSIRQIRSVVPWTSPAATRQSGRPSRQYDLSNWRCFRS